jgi:cell fate (sporulation/competence/biofilm development) regulator YlbF (YheA/YmcA/DUF963 family)
VAVAAARDNPRAALKDLWKAVHRLPCPAKSKANDMNATLEPGAVLDKTLELCQTIVSQPDFTARQRDIETFLLNEDAKRLYQTVAEKGESLHHKQHQGESLTETEIADYEQHRQSLFANDVAKRFLDAQQELHQMQDAVTRYVAKSIELGRVASAEDFESCGAGCSCGH